MWTDSYTEAPTVILNAIRSIFTLFDRAVYGLLEMVYQLFFNVASSDIFANDTIMKFYSRVQLILGVFMMFQLAMIILRGIVNPDDFTNSKTGFGNVIMRICVALFLLTALVPINIPSPRNEYEIQLNNNGLLFGTLYSLQHRLLENNTLGRLILGTNDTDSSYVSNSGTSNSNNDSLKKSSRLFTTTIFKSFFRINLLPEDEFSDKCKNADDPAIYPECRMCQEVNSEAIITGVYENQDASVGDLISQVNEECNSNLYTRFVSNTNKYIFIYDILLSTAVGIVWVVSLIAAVSVVLPY